MDRKRIRGIQAILPTPYKDNLEIDYNDLEKCVEFCAASLVHGIVTTVNASEFQLLSENERKEVIKTVCKRADGRMSVMVGITGKTVQETLTYAKCAKEYGAQSVIAMPPYVSHIKEEEIYEFYRRLNEEGSFIDNGNGNLDFTSDDGSIKGTIQINGWNGATFEVTETIGAVPFSVGEKFEFPFAF